MTPKKPHSVPVTFESPPPAASSVVAHESQAPAPSNRSPYHVARFGSVSIRFNTETEAFDVVHGDTVLPITAVRVTLA